MEIRLFYVRLISTMGFPILVRQYHYMESGSLSLYVENNMCGNSETWWRHQMEIFSALLAICAENSPVPREFPAQRPVTRSFDVFFYLRLNKRLSKQSWGWWFETLSHPLWRHCNTSWPRCPLLVGHAITIEATITSYAQGFLYMIYNQVPL